MRAFMALLFNTSQTVSWSPCPWLNWLWMTKPETDYTCKYSCELRNGSSLISSFYPYFSRFFSHSLHGWKGLFLVLRWHFLTSHDQSRPLLFKILHFRIKPLLQTFKFWIFLFRGFLKFLFLGNNSMFSSRLSLSLKWKRSAVHRSLVPAQVGIIWFFGDHCLIFLFDRTLMYEDNCPSL